MAPPTEDMIVVGLGAVALLGFGYMLLMAYYVGYWDGKREE